MRPLTTADIAELEQLLRSERSGVLSALRARLHQSDDPREMALANTFDAVDDRAAADLANDTDIALLCGELGELQAIDAALERIGAGSYGKCDDCGEDIGHSRMRAQPTANKCLPCQEASERRPNHAPGGLPRL